MTSDSVEGDGSAEGEGGGASAYKLPFPVWLADVIVAQFPSRDAKSEFSRRRASERPSLIDQIVLARELAAETIVMVQDFGRGISVWLDLMTGEYLFLVNDNFLRKRFRHKAGALDAAVELFGAGKGLVGAPDATTQVHPDPLRR